jgi:hypothetical protein
MVLVIRNSNKLIVYRKSTKYLSYINYTPLTHTAFQAFENIFKRNLKFKYFYKQQNISAYVQTNIRYYSYLLFKQTYSLISYEPEIIKV